MTLTGSVVVTFALALVTIANPIGNMAVFAALTGDRDDAKKQRNDKLRA